MDELITILGVAGYIDENGTGYLRLADVVRGLGFTQIKGGNEYIRYERVNGYLADLGFPHLLGKEFIPENAFYRLAMKGETTEALKFQQRVADEILPAIRRNGAYMTDKLIERTLTDPDYMNEVLKNIKAEREARLAAEQKISEEQQRLAYTQLYSKGQIPTNTVSV